ncbi:MAG: hypothetical protein GX316_08150 [Firmicutes bacterium]|nr:hypothetical protein [Bacillota bacterium]
MNESYNDIRKERISRALELSPYLEGGLYDFDDGLKVLCQKSQRSSLIIDGLSFHNSNPLTQVSINNDQPKHFYGRIMWFCSSGDIKIFSDAETLIICCSKSNYLRKINNYDYFSRFFQIPKLIHRDEANNILIEEFIDFKGKNNQDDDVILRTIYEDYTSYFVNINNPSTVNYKTMNNLLMVSSRISHLEQFKYIIDLIDPSLFGLEFPFIKLHGDLWTANLLLEKDNTNNRGLWYIDWDESGEYIFFFDFFKFIWNELDVNCNYTYLEKYLKGCFDCNFENLFKIFQLEFLPEHRKSYLCMFFLNFILDETGMMAYKAKHQEIVDFRTKVVPLIQDF